MLSGHSAAALLDAECAPRRGTPAEVTLLRGNLRAHPGLVVRRGLLRHDEITHVRDVACTTPLRTAFDLARGADRDAAVVAVDRLANRHRFDLDRLWSSTRATGAVGGEGRGRLVGGRRVHRLTPGYGAPWPPRPRSCSTSTAR